MVKNTNRKSAAPAAAAPTLDYGSLAVADAEMPKQDRASKVESTPFLGWLRDSYESSKAKAVTVPGANVREVVGLVRMAANRLNIGSRVVITDTNGKTVKDAKDCNPRMTYTVTFAGKQRKQPRKAKASE